MPEADGSFTTVEIPDGDQFLVKGIMIKGATLRDTREGNRLVFQVHTELSPDAVTGLARLFKREGLSMIIVDPQAALPVEASATNPDGTVIPGEVIPGDPTAPAEPTMNDGDNWNGKDEAKRREKVGAEA